MRSLASDNNLGVHPAIIEALTRANQDHALGYGDDSRTEEAVRGIKEMFVADCKPLFVFNGIDNNIVALQLLTRPYNSIICAETAHIYVDRCGSPMKMTGCQIRPVVTPGEKLTPELVAPYLYGFGDRYHSQPGAVYLSECTELGTIYTPGELRTITSLTHQHGMRVHMDDAHIANACAVLDLSLKTLTVDCGIDVLSFGGTKSGLMMGEYVIVFGDSLKAEARFIREQSAQLVSKTRYLSCQSTAYLTEELWLKNAMYANAMTKRLYEVLRQIPGVRFAQKVKNDQLFLTMPRIEIDRMLQSYFFYFWNEEADEIHLVTSFGTTEEDIDTFIRVLKKQDYVQ